MQQYAPLHEIVISSLTPYPCLINPLPPDQRTILTLPHPPPIPTPALWPTVLHPPNMSRVCGPLDASSFPEGDRWFASDCHVCTLRQPVREQRGAPATLHV